MTPKDRFLSALRNEKPDRLPVTTHHLMPSFLERYFETTTNEDFFEQFGIDPIHWIVAYQYSSDKGEYFDPTHEEVGFLEARRVCSDDWRISIESLQNQKYPTKRFSIHTPDQVLSMVLQSDVHSTWLTENIIKNKKDIEVLAKYMTYPRCDVDAINKKAEEIGGQALIRGHICVFDGFGQPGCWQDAACLYGIENLIMATFEDPDWVHEFLGILMERKKFYIRSMVGARYDLLELGGGDASTTVISPDIFRDFVAPYDAELIEAAHKAGQRIAYHTCGGMMPILEDIAAMNPDAMETFTPSGMGGDVNLMEAKRRIGDKVCMIGGFDQFKYFMDSTEEEVRREVRRCFEAAGEGGGYILSPSDHFFDANLKLIAAFAEEAQMCTY